MPATKRIRYGAPGDVKTFVQTFTASDDVASGRTRLVQRYSYGGSSLSPEDVRTIVDAFEQLDWVQWTKAQMVAAQKAPGQFDEGQEDLTPARPHG